MLGNHEVYGIYRYIIYWKFDTSERWLWLAALQDQPTEALKPQSMTTQGLYGRNIYSVINITYIPPKKITLLGFLWLLLLLVISRSAFFPPINLTTQGLFSELAQGTRMNLSFLGWYHGKWRSIMLHVTVLIYLDLPSVCVWVCFLLPVSPKKNSKRKNTTRNVSWTTWFECTPHNITPQIKRNKTQNNSHY